MAKAVKLTVNGKRHTVSSAPDTPLLYVLRNELDLHGPRFGCGLSQCGACTVHIDGQALRSCIVPVSTVAGKKVTTLEGLGTAKNRIRSSRRSSPRRPPSAATASTGW